MIIMIIIIAKVCSSEQTKKWYAFVLALMVHFGMFQSSSLTQVQTILLPTGKTVNLPYP